MPKKNKLIELLKTQPKKLLMTHMIVGFPTLTKSVAIAETMISSGADIIELQIPFSDPMADGSVIAAACQTAIKYAPSPTHTFALATHIEKKHPATPLIIMCYANSMFRHGIEAFVEDAAKCGISGLIVPDLPFDTPEGTLVLATAKKVGMCIIPVVSPGVHVKRLKQILPHGSGFVYCTSRQGTTGKATAMDVVATYTDILKECTKLPLGIGFGISTAADVQNVHTHAAIAIAGSVFIKTAQLEPEKALEHIAKLVSSLKNA